jgi:hypothetical protein
MPESHCWVQEREPEGPEALEVVVVLGPDGLPALETNDDVPPPKLEGPLGLPALETNDDVPPPKLEGPLGLPALETNKEGLDVVEEVVGPPVVEEVGVGLGEGLRTTSQYA